jgi:hypothetical protein
MKFSVPVQAARYLGCRPLQKMRTPEAQVEISCLADARIGGLFTPP